MMEDLPQSGGGNATEPRLPPSWYDGEGPSDEIVVASRVRLARNAADVAFPGRMTRQEAVRLLATAERFFRRLAADYGGPLLPVDLYGADEADRDLYKEKGFLPEDLRNATQRLFVSGDESLAALVNQEDHFHLTAIQPGLDLTRLLVRLRLVEESLEREIPFAVNLEWGYLSTRLSNLGTAMSASVLMHLPVLAKSLEMEALAAAVEEDGVSLKIFRPGTSYADYGLLIVGNTVTLGRSEHSVLDQLAEMTDVLLHYEKNALQTLRERDATGFEDRVWRANGLLTSCRRIEEFQAVEALTDLRLGMMAGMLPDIRPIQINRLLFRCQEAHLWAALPMLKLHGTCDTLDEARATMIRGVLSGRF